VSDKRKRRPEPISSAISNFLNRAGIAKRVEQAHAIADWAELVGPQIAGVTEPLSVTQDGVLFVAVRTNAWMNELSMMERELLERLNHDPQRAPIRRIRWQLMR
jgi:predicted nucleic acid-binding Zn ribbon protein